jgi:hypothetical protein
MSRRKTDYFQTDPNFRRLLRPIRKIDSEHAFWLAETLAVAIAKEEVFEHEHGDQWALEFWVLISKPRDLPTNLLAEVTRMRARS